MEFLWCGRSRTLARASGALRALCRGANEICQKPRGLEKTCGTMSRALDSAVAVARTFGQVTQAELDSINQMQKREENKRGACALPRRPAPPREVHAAPT